MHYVPHGVDFEHFDVDNSNNPRVAYFDGNGGDLKIGIPLVSGATVKATIVAHGKHEKVRIFKMRRRKHYQKHQGHRQNYTELKIDAIVG